MLELDAIKALWRKNSDVLGFFPSGAFEQRAQNGQILAAFDGASLAGYVLWYSDKSARIRLSHLCVSESFRGRGVAGALVAALRAETKAYRGIGLYCRRDFPSWGMWPKLGFQAVREKIGHGRDGQGLTYFWQPYRQKSLFSECEEPDEAQVSTVIDANVFYDFLDSSRSEAEESLGLAADWLKPAIRLCVTPELFNEIQRNPNADERASRMASAQTFFRIEASLEEFESARQGIERLCGVAVTDRDSADQRQLAWTIASGSDVFVTRDQKLLEFADALYAAYGVTIERPAAVVSRFDEILNEHEYQRERVAGTDVRIARQTGSADVLADAFSPRGHQESPANVARLLNRAFANPSRFLCKVVSGNAAHPLCMYLIEWQDSHSCDVRFVRLHSSLDHTRFGSTLIRSIVATIVQEVADAGMSVVRVTDPHLVPVVTAAIKERRFFRTSGCWTKLCLGNVSPLEAIGQRLRDIVSLAHFPSEEQARILEVCDSASKENDAAEVFELERTIWPGKISGTSLRNFVIPIRPGWAADLFEGRLAKQRLWGADTGLVLNPDSVYYRSPKPRVVTAPGRILWYVSDGKAEGAKMLRASSHLTGVHIGKPKDLFRKFQRFGVYEWHHVLETAGSLDEMLMAIEFTNTELFANPVSWELLQQELLAQGKDNYTFPSPVEIDESLFLALYRHGMGLPAGA